MSRAGDQATPTPRQPKAAAARRRIALVIVAGAVGLGAYFGIRHILHARSYVSTDDAFVAAHVVAVSPRIASTAARVLVEDNAHVARGQLLVELDARDVRARLAKARSTLAAARAEHEAAAINVKVVSATSTAGVDRAAATVHAAENQAASARSEVGAAEAERVAAEAEATRASTDAARYERLLTTHVVSRQQRDNAVAASRTAQAGLQAARRTEQAATSRLHEAENQVAVAKARLAEARAGPDQVAYSRAQVQQAEARIAELEAAVRLVELDLSYTKILSPAAGRVTRKSVEAGDYLEVGQRLLSIVPDEVWVVANFKETQLRRIRPGQSATVTFDAYPDRVFHGHVESVQAGSGAAFSLLPPENATGNYVKVVQRVPVKIVIDDPPDPTHVLGPGLSAVPTVRVR